MKRFEQLRKLSVDHHHGLVLARRSRKEAETMDKNVISNMWDNIILKFENELEPHFQIEEKYIAPALATKGIQEQLSRFYSDHENLRKFVDDKTIKNDTNLFEFAKLLISHIRFEEEVLFELAQQLLDDSTLKEIETACATR